MLIRRTQILLILVRRPSMLKPLRFIQKLECVIPVLTLRVPRGKSGVLIVRIRLKFTLLRGRREKPRSLLILVPCLPLKLMHLIVKILVTLVIVMKFIRLIILVRCCRRRTCRRRGALIILKFGRRARF